MQLGEVVVDEAIIWLFVFLVVLAAGDGLEDIETLGPNIVSMVPVSPPSP
jgi:hypothetical protein